MSLIFKPEHCESESAIRRYVEVMKEFNVVDCFKSYKIIEMRKAKFPLHDILQINEKV